MQLRGACLGLALLAAPQGAQAAADAGTAKAILMRSVAVRTVQGAGQVPKLAAYYADVLRQAGFAEEDIVITPMGETATFAATIRGRDAALKPLLMIGHMDVVEADPKDWTRDPFVPVEENGYIFGRGAEDNKYDVAMMVATLAQLKKEGWTPRRTVTLLLSGDEETDMATTRALANAEYNGLAAKTEFACRNLFEVTADDIAALGRFDRWLVDPPREGALAVSKALGELAQQGSEVLPRRIVYVSCSPATLARDAGLLVHEAGYRLSGAGVVNMFPHTSHVESIAVFERD